MRRPRLTRLLDASTARIIVLRAPAGYGKTTLAAEWLQGRPDEDVAWYYASPASADVAALSVGIAEAVSHILPAGDRVRQRLRVPQVPDNNAEILAELLAHDLTAWPEKAWLVLDDYHHAMESKSAERFVEELLRLTPIRLLLTTRRRPTWLTARRVVYGEVTELDEGQLGMTEQEAANVLSRGRLNKTTECKHLDGWPVLVGLAALAEEGDPESSAIHDDFFQYLADEVIASETAENRKLLLAASIPPFLTLEILELMHGQPDELALSELVERGILRKELRSRWRLHPLLREFLRQQVARECPKLAKQVGRQVFARLVANRDWDGALRLATELKEPELVQTAFEAASRDLLKSGRLDTLERVVANLAEESQLRPEVLLARAEAELRRGHFRKCATLSFHVATRQVASTTLQARAWVLHGRARHLLSEHHAALRAYECASAIATDGSIRREIAWGQFIVASELGFEDISQRLNAFEGLAGNETNMQLRVAAGSALVSLYEAREAAGQNSLRKALSLVELADDPMAISHTLSLATAVSVAAADYAEALRRARHAIDYCRSLRLEFAEAYCIAYRAGAEIGTRSLRAARASLAEIEERSLLAEDSHLWLLRSILTVKLRVAERKGAIAARCCPSVERTDYEDLPPAQAGELLALEALIHAAIGQREQALLKIARVGSLTNDPTPSLYAEFASLVLQVADSSQRDTVQKRLANLIDEAARFGHLDVFVTAYRASPTLLALMPDDARSLSLARRAVRSARDEGIVSDLEDGAAAILLPHEAKLALTPREIEVAALVAQGLSNGEIAAHLYIAPSTVKVHVRNILKKLGASTRLEAALRWSEFSRGA